MTNPAGSEITTLCNNPVVWIESESARTQFLAAPQPSSSFSVQGMLCVIPQGANYRPCRINDYLYPFPSYSCLRQPTRQKGENTVFATPPQPDRDGRRNNICFRPSASAMQIRIWARVARGSSQPRRAPASPIGRCRRPACWTVAGPKWQVHGSIGLALLPSPPLRRPGDGLRQPRRRRIVRLRRARAWFPRRAVSVSPLCCINNAWNDRGAALLPASRIGTQQAKTIARKRSDAVQC
jgi:hypothetical protein